MGEEPTVIGKIFEANSAQTKLVPSEISMITLSKYSCNFTLVINQFYSIHFNLLDRHEYAKWIYAKLVVSNKCCCEPKVFVLLQH